MDAEAEQGGQGKEAPAARASPLCWHTGLAASLVLALALAGAAGLAAALVSAWVAKGGDTQTLPGEASALLAPIGCEEFKGRTVIMVTSSVEVNNMFQNWFVHTRQFLNESTDQVVVIAYDNQTLDLLTGSAERIPPPSFVVVSSEYFQAAGTTSGRRLRAPSWTADVIGKFNFATPGFGDITRHRPSSMLHFVEKGCDVLYSDTDMVWQKNPLDETRGGSDEFYVASEEKEWDYKGSPWGRRPGGSFCTGFLYARSGEVSIDILGNWSANIEGNENDCWHDNDQPCFNEYMGSLAKEAGSMKAALQNMNVSVLPRSEHPSGAFAIEYPDATVLHANYIIGNDKKVQFFKDRGLWNPDAFWSL